MKRRIGAALAAVALLTLSACGSSDSDGGKDETAAFSYTDDLGNKIALDEMPERLLVQSSMAAALTDLGLGDKIVGVFGPLKADGDAEQVAGLDIDSVEDVTGGGDYGDVDAQKAAGLKPDLIITSSYLEPDLWYLNEASAKKLKNLAPIMVVSFDGKTLPELLDSTERAAEALGADLDSDEVTATHDAFTAAGDRVKKISAELGDRTILAGSAAKDYYYVSNPKVSPDLSYWVDELGLPLTIPDNPDEGGYFESLSWENADKYPADIFLYDDRIGEAGLKLLDGEKVFATLDAAKNDAYVPWSSVAPPSYQAYADLMDRLVDDLEKQL
ncbi:ABC transporter substrate-binding protein [Aeromicrobium wangtongii]|uniref:ABC transporter substrate-binding protein n=1 Tax=Aeromicrobium wangtongii TaxID=2969247 RepID=A0ABY5M4K6_9ACTN|nr:ABC transporter substrate-binding protein [Aeromicrobium wangtongii]MCD9198850.1 ABC transporter substrate-binding protein [Aeromicrobium wangtongii]UUP13110.1 ABC transporter substrate-binding protein [Aeromicrobium wangtongii]